MVKLWLERVSQYFVDAPNALHRVQDLDVFIFNFLNMWKKRMGLSCTHIQSKTICSVEGGQL